MHLINLSTVAVGMINLLIILMINMLLFKGYLFGRKIFAMVTLTFTQHITNVCDLWLWLPSVANQRLNEKFKLKIYFNALYFSNKLFFSVIFSKMCQFYFNSTCIVTSVYIIYSHKVIIRKFIYRKDRKE